MSPVAVWSRTTASAKELADRIECSCCNDICLLPPADIVIISVVDSALCEVAGLVAKRYPNALVLHTAGSIPIDVLRNVGCKRYGVFYPMQTFSKSRLVDFSTVNVFVEGYDKETETEIACLAKNLGSKAYIITSEQRRMLHLSAVFACNFSNAMYAVSARLLEENGLSFDVMLPLIDETVSKVHTLHPTKAQTGPAARGDENVLKAQRGLLNEDLGEIYDVVSRYIMKNRING